MSKLFRFLHHIDYDEEKESNVPVQAGKLAKRSVCESFSVAAHEEINILSYYGRPA